MLTNPTVRELVRVGQGQIIGGGVKELVVQINYVDPADNIAAGDTTLQLCTVGLRQLAAWGNEVDEDKGLCEWDHNSTFSLFVSLGLITRTPTSIFALKYLSHSRLR